MIICQKNVITYSYHRMFISLSALTTFKAVCMRNNDEGEDRSEGQGGQPEQENRGEETDQAEETEGSDHQPLLQRRAEDIELGRRADWIGVYSGRVDRNAELNEMSNGNELDGVSVTGDGEQGEEELNHIEEGGQGIEAGNDEENLDERTVQAVTNNEESTIEAEESDDRLGLVGNVDDGNAEGRSDQQSPVIIGNGEENVGGNESSGEGYDVESVQNQEVEGRVESEERAAAPAGDEEEEVGDREGGYEGDEDTTVEEEGMSDRTTSNEGINQAEDRNEENQVMSDRTTSNEEIDQAEDRHEGDEEMSDGTSSDEGINQAEDRHEREQVMSDRNTSNQAIEQTEDRNEGDEELGHDASSSLEEDVGGVGEIRGRERIANEDENSGVWVRGLEDQVRPVARVRPVPVVDDLRRPEEANNSDQGVFVASGR